MAGPVETTLGRNPHYLYNLVSGEEIPSDIGLSRREDVLENMSFAFCEKYPETNSKINTFLTKVDAAFTDETENGFVKKALNLATAAHQFNIDKDKRLRKGENNRPYIEHPLEVSETLLDNGFDWITVTASLLHDVPEDVDFGPGLQTPQEWLEFIKEEFNQNSGTIRVGINNDRLAGDLLAEIIEGLTEKPLPENPDEIKQLRATPFHKMITNFLHEIKPAEEQEPLGQKEIDKENRAVDKVIFNLDQLFDKALRSPDHWRIFLIKITDIYRNLKTIDKVRPAKLLRARIAASLAETFGWYGIRSEIIKMLPIKTPYKPEIEAEAEDAGPNSILAEIDKYKNVVAADLSALLGSETVLSDNQTFTGWPLRQAGYDSALPEMILALNLNSIQKLDKKNIPTNNKLRPSTDNILTTKLFGRKSISSSLRKNNSGIQHPFHLRLQSNEPHLVDLFKRDKNASLEEVPEAKLFNNRLQKGNRQEWFYHLNALIGFLYAHNLPVIFGHQLVVTVIDNQILFINGERNTGEVLEMMGRPSEDTEIKTYDGQEKIIKTRYQFLIACKTSDCASHSLLKRIVFFLNPF